MSNEINDIASKELWEKAKSFYLMSLNAPDEKNQAERYFEMITAVNLKDNTFEIFTNTEFAADLIRENYANKLKGSFMLAGASPDIELRVKYDPTARTVLVVPEVSRTMTGSQGGVDEPFVSTMPLNENFTFKEFVRGPSNSYALSAAEGVVKNPGKPGYNPLFIYGGTGLGKTHLMQAIGNELIKKNPTMAICYLSAEKFMTEYVNAMTAGTLSQFQERYRSLDMLLLDDVQFLQRGKQMQEVFFNIFNELRDTRHKQIVMTSDVPPNKLPAVEERLISRFQGGMVQEVENPKYETRLAILKKKVQSSDVKVPEYVLEFIADNIKSHVRAMEGALAKVTIVISAEPELRLTNDNLKYILKDFIERETRRAEITISAIQEACAKKYGVSISDIKSHDRMASLVTPRQLAMFISKKLTSKGLEEIGKAFDKRHATIINGVKSIEKRLDNEPELKINLEEILSTFGCRLTDVID